MITKYIALFLILFSPLSAHAASGNSTIGNLIENVTNGLYGPFVFICVSAAFLVGFFLLGKGIMKLKEASSSQSQNIPKEGILMIGGGSALLVLPDMLNAGLLTLFNTKDTHVGHASIGSVKDCFGDTGDAGVTCVAQNIASNVTPIFTVAFFVMAFVTGLFMIFSQIRKLAVSHEHGRHELEKGWLLKLCVGVIVCNLPFIVYAIEQTLGITSNGVVQVDGYDASSSFLSYTGSGTTSATLQKYAELIGYIFRILVIFGLIAVWRGISLLKSFAEGRQDKTVGAALTHIIGGVCLTNAKFTTCVILTTFWGSGNGFC